MDKLKNAQIFFSVGECERGVEEKRGAGGKENKNPEAGNGELLSSKGPPKLSWSVRVNTATPLLVWVAMDNLFCGVSAKVARPCRSKLLAT